MSHFRRNQISKSVCRSRNRSFSSPALLFPKGLGIFRVRNCRSSSVWQSCHNASFHFEKISRFLQTSVLFLFDFRQIELRPFISLDFYQGCWFHRRQSCRRNRTPSIDKIVCFWGSCARPNYVHSVLWRGPPLQPDNGNAIHLACLPRHERSR